jgi:hypothetical protein
MKPAGKTFFWLMAGTAAGLLAPPARAADESAPQSSPEVEAGKPAALRPALSPVESFRKLLGMSPAERDRFLARYPAATRERILAKLQDYQILPPELRELRLQVTELRWYLAPVLRVPPTNRVAQLQLIPEPYRELVAARLDEWDILPPPLKDDVLQYEKMMNCFVGRNAVVEPQMAVEDVPEKERPELERKLARWQALPLDQRRQMYASFQHYFELSDEERQKTMAALSQPERQETEKALDSIEKQPKSRQEQYLAAFRQFGEMSAEEREQFMKNAERWRKMSPAERQAWRDFVKQLSEMPPLPPGTVPLHVQPAGPSQPVPVKTNSTATPLK